MKKWKITIIIGITCSLLTIAICVQLNTIKEANLSVSSDYAENNLRDEVLKAKQRYDEKVKELDLKEKELEKVREQATKDSESASKMEEQIRNNNNLMGMGDIEGKGIEVTVKDDPNVTIENIGALDSIEDHIVHDADLRWIVNVLNNAGAEAISINGQRIVDTTAITCVGNVIKINDEKVASPFIIKAIGYPESLAGIDIAGGYMDYMRSAGIIVNIKKMNNVQIPKYTGVLQSKYMKIIK